MTADPQLESLHRSFKKRLSRAKAPGEEAALRIIQKVEQRTGA